MERIATKAAKKSKFSRARIGAVVVKGHRVLAVAYNQVRYKKSLTEKVWPNSLHAEQAALLQIDPDMCKGAVMYVSRINKRGDLVLSRPCSVCLGLIQKMKLKAVYFTNNAGLWEKLDL